MAEHPAALQRLLETVVEVAAEMNSTLVLPFPWSCALPRTRHPPTHRTPTPNSSPVISPPPWQSDDRYLWMRLGEVT